MLLLSILLAVSAIPTVLMLACCAMAGQADRRAAEIFNRREGRRPGEVHVLASAGSTPAPATSEPDGFEPGKESIGPDDHGRDVPTGVQIP